MNADTWETEIAQVVLTLRSGGVVLYPTDTIWGLGCDPENSAAVRKLFELKGRPAQKSLILLADNWNRLAPYIKVLPIDQLEKLRKTSPRPLTVILPDAEGLAIGVTAEDQSVGVRVTDDPFCKALIEKFGKPITSTSANLSGMAFGGSFVDVDPSIVAGADYVVHWRQGEMVGGLASRVVRLLPEGKVEVIRE
jgi:L-threonylcarbamoyladenylate synthase